MSLLKTAGCYFLRSGFIIFNIIKIILNIKRKGCFAKITLFCIKYKNLIDKHKSTQEELAEILGVSRQAISKWESSYFQ